jgi:DNA-binding FadR family transcriptional regulator
MPIDAKNPFHAVQKTRASLQIVDQARDLITRGDLKPGDRLPSERKLAEILGVGRTTVREALRTMESLGLVEVRPGEGTFLADPTARRRPELLGTDGVDSWSTQLNLLELRAVLEPPLAGLAARRATPEHLVRMRAALTAVRATPRRTVLCVAEGGTPRPGARVWPGSAPAQI